MTSSLLGAFVRGRIICRWLVVCGVVLATEVGPLGSEAFAKACVWRVTDGAHTLYLAGSVHALRGADYPLPAEYDQAFQASSVLAFETDMTQMGKTHGFLLAKAAILPKGSTLRDHLDPRVYAYILKVAANAHSSTDPAKKLEHLRPWAVAWLLQSPGGITGLSGGEGIESYLIHKAAQAHKPTVGLVPLDEHIAVFGGMNDADSQTYLLLRFIQLDQESKEFQQVVANWKHGDIDAINRATQEDYRDAPSLQRRLITDRNRRWIPEIAKWLGSGQTYMVVAGAAHMAGPDGVPALLRAQGFQVEQL